MGACSGPDGAPPAFTGQGRGRLPDIACTWSRPMKRRRGKKLQSDDLIRRSHAGSPPRRPRALRQWQRPAPELDLLWTCGPIEPGRSRPGSATTAACVSEQFGDEAPHRSALRDSAGCGALACPIPCRPDAKRRVPALIRAVYMVGTARQRVPRIARGGLPCRAMGRDVACKASGTQIVSRLRLQLLEAGKGKKSEVCRRR
jgi:hypothetical protein